MTTTCLAFFPIPAVDKALKETDVTQIRLAQGKRRVEQLPKRLAPALLVSYYYLEPFLKNQSGYVYRDWVLDSGAYSAFNSGATIDLEKYIEKCLELMESDPTLTEIFALDVIGDHKASLKNTERMWDAGERTSRNPI